MALYLIGCVYFTKQIGSRTNKETAILVRTQVPSRPEESDFDMCPFLCTYRIYGLICAMINNRIDTILKRYATSKIPLVLNKHITFLSSS